jgi:hypothetical protein
MQFPARQERGKLRRNGFAQAQLARAAALTAQLDSARVCVMDAIAIRQVLGQRPFKTFVLHLADGRALEVPHPDFASISQSGRRVIVEKSDDSFEIVDVLLVNSVEVKPSTSAAA